MVAGIPGAWSFSGPARPGCSPRQHSRRRAARSPFSNGTATRCADGGRVLPRPGVPQSRRAARLPAPGPARSREAPARPARRPRPARRAALRHGDAAVAQRPGVAADRRTGLRGGLREPPLARRRSAFPRGPPARRRVPLGRSSRGAVPHEVRGVAGPGRRSGWRRGADPVTADLAARCTPLGDVVHPCGQYRINRPLPWSQDPGPRKLGPEPRAPAAASWVTPSAPSTPCTPGHHGRRVRGGAPPRDVGVRRNRGGRAARLVPRSARRFASVVDLPWAVATGEDGRFLPGESRESGPRRLLGAWTGHPEPPRRARGPRAALQLARVYHLMGSPLGLFHPALVVSALRAGALGYGPPAPRPASLEALRT